MGQHRFSPGVTFRWQNTAYAIRRTGPHAAVTIVALAADSEQDVDESILRRALFDGDLTFLPRDQPWPAGAGETGTQAAPFLPWDDYPVPLRAVAEARLAVLQPLLDQDRSTWPRALVAERVRTVQAARANASTLPRSLPRAASVSSVYRWRARYAAFGNDLRALIPATRRRGGKGRSRLPGVDELVNAVLADQVFQRERVTIDDLLQEMARRVAAENRTRAPTEQLRVPSRATIARRVAALDQRTTFAARHGQRAMQRHFAQWGEATEPPRPLARVEIDHTRIPVIVIDEHDNLPLGRPVLTYCLDVATRYPLGYYLGFEPFSYYAVLECLSHAIRPKDGSRERYGCTHEWLAYGVPTVLVTDNGWEFVGNDLRDACLALGITLQQTPVRTPEFKGSIERSFATLDTGLFTTLPGTTFANPRARGDYDSVEQACLTMGDLDRLLHLFLVDHYAQDRHTGLGGETPAQRWATLTADPFRFAPAVPRSAEDLKVLLSRVTWRTVQPYGIEFATLRYNDDALATFRDRLKPGEKVKVKYHPGDLSRLYVFDPVAARYLEVPALAQDYTQGLSLWKHRVLREKVRAEHGQVDLAALGQAKDAMRQIVAQARERKRTNARVARWTTGGASFRDLATVGGGEAAAPGKSSEGAAPPATAPVDLNALLANLTPDAPGWQLSFPPPTDRPHEEGG
jgi:putative transposase